ncbi:MAG TPA: protease inhibitor I9 family protein, partial [Adhaeribacter sp.]|nr:protease inhibitor I9 family protein [Adhaeribacter sp.]
CDKSEMDDIMPAAHAEAKKADAPGQVKNQITPNATQTADSVYIVTFHDTNNQLQTELDVQNLATSIGGTIQFEWTYWEGTKGFAAPLTQNQVTTFRNDSRVEFVEADGPIYPTNP